MPGQRYLSHAILRFFCWPAWDFYRYAAYKAYLLPFSLPKKNLDQLPTFLQWQASSGLQVELPAVSSRSTVSDLVEGLDFSCRRFGQCIRYNVAVDDSCFFRGCELLLHSLTLLCNSGRAGWQTSLLSQVFNSMFGAELAVSALAHAGDAGKISK